MMTEGGQIVIGHLCSFSFHKLYMQTEYKIKKLRNDSFFIS